jgi:hypothetical protein
MKYIFSLIIGGALVVSGFGQTRNVLVGTNNAVVQPTNFWSADASNARSGLGLGSAATNPASAFQPSSSNLSNVAANDGVGLTNLNATNLVGTLSVSKGGTGSTNASDARLSLGLGTASTNPATAFQPADSDLNALASNNGGSLTNLQSTNIVGIIPASNIATVNFSNLGGTLAISSGGTGATNAGGARTNLSLGWSALTNTNSATSLLGHTTNGTVVYTGPDYLAFTNSDVIFNRLTIGNLLFMGDASGLFIDGDASIFLGTALTKSNFRNELGLGWSALTNSNSATSLLGFTTSGQVVASTGTNALTFTNTVSISAGQVLTPSGTTNFVGIGVGATNVGLASGGAIQGHLGLVSGGNLMAVFSGSTIFFYGPLTFMSGVEQTRTNLGLGWPALTNTNAAGFNASLYGSGTNPVLYNTNGDVVSPTNFWQQAPIATTVAFSAPATNSTNTATNSRNLIIQSLSSNIVNTTNTLLLPTNTSTFNGDTAVVIHAGGSGSATAIRQAGQTSNLIVLTNFDHAVRFLYFNNTWDFYHNLAYVEPIYFSGTNALANAAASRTNLGLGGSDSVSFNKITIPLLTGSGIGNIDFGNGVIMGRKADQDVVFNVSGGDEVFIGSRGVVLSGNNSISFSTNNTNGAAITRTNLGIPLPALTNTNNANFQAAVFATNSNPTNGGNFNNHVAWMEVTVQTNGSNVSFRVPLYK